MSERPYTLTGGATIEQGVWEMIAHVVREVVAQLTCCRAASLEARAAPACVAAARLGPAARLRERFDGAAQAALLPAASVSRARAEHLERWRDAARLWLACWDEFETWRQEANELPAETRRDPLHVVQRLIPVARRLARRLSSTRELRRALPALLASALARHDGDPWAPQIAAEPPVDGGDCSRWPADFSWPGIPAARSGR